MPAALGSRPDRLSEVRPQERAQRRTVQQIVDPVPLPALDDPAPQMVGQLLKLAHFLDRSLPDPEQVIEVPKILSDDVPMRALVRETQLSEQLVEVPTVVSWSLLQLITKQNVDIPVPGGGVRGLQGFPPGQASTTSSFSLERILSGLWSRTSNSLLVEAFKIFSQDRAHLHLLHLQLVFVVLQMGLEKGIFALFPKLKKCEVGLALGVGTAPRVEPIHAGSSCERVVWGGAFGQVPAAL